MVWIPPGALIAGTPPGRLPRVADEEMAGEQIMMQGFMIDVFPSPNEFGAIPATNLTASEAKDLCAEQNKRLCTELELERACKGPDNTTYEYGDTYDEKACATDRARMLTPNGLHASCKSAFGVHDLHGGVWSWTASRWGRGGTPGDLTLRGGSGGEVHARCAQGRPLAPSARASDVGVRCCAGEVNQFEVVLEVERGEPLTQTTTTPESAQSLERILPEGDADPFRVEHIWTWRPIGNEALLLGGGCAGTKDEPRCGVIVARPREFDAPSLLTFVTSDRWQPTLSKAGRATQLYVYGGDSRGAHRTLVRYDAGRIVVGAPQHKYKR